MFPLHSRTFPASAPDLARLLSESVRALFIVRDDPVRIQETAYPELASLHLCLDHAELRPNPPRPPEVTGDSVPALSVAELQLTASQLSIGPATGDLRLIARNVDFDYARDSAGEIVLLLRSAATGEVEVSAETSQLEAAIAAVARHEAGKQGVTIEEVQLTVHERGPRGLSGELRLQARKLFFSTVVHIAADLDLDQQLNAVISGLTCKGDGAIGALACGVLSPHLQKLNGRSFPLLALPLGEIRLRDVQLSAAGAIRVTAQFGA